MEQKTVIFQMTYHEKDRGIGPQEDLKTEQRHVQSLGRKDYAGSVAIMVAEGAVSLVTAKTPYFLDSTCKLSRAPTVLVYHRIVAYTQARWYFHHAHPSHLIMLMGYLSQTWDFDEAEMVSEN